MYIYTNIHRYIYTYVARVGTRHEESCGRSHTEWPQIQLWGGYGQ